MRQFIAEAQPEDFTLLYDQFTNNERVCDGSGKNRGHGTWLVALEHATDGATAAATLVRTCRTS
jgi:hypothetical protein